MGWGLPKRDSCSMCFIKFRVDYKHLPSQSRPVKAKETPTLWWGTIRISQQRFKTFIKRVHWVSKSSSLVGSTASLEPHSYNILRFNIDSGIIVYTYNMSPGTILFFLRLCIGSVKIHFLRPWRQKYIGMLFISKSQQKLKKLIPTCSIRSYQ